MSFSKIVLFLFIGLCSINKGFSAVKDMKDKEESFRMNKVIGRDDKEQAFLEDITLGARYDHYKGMPYRVVGVFRHSETLDLYVAYEALYEVKGGYGNFWIRPLSMFVENVLLDGVQVPRFKKVGE